MRRTFNTILFSVLGILVSSCTFWTNPTPDFIETDQISFDNGVQNSGVLSASPDGKGFIVTKNLIARYNAMMDLIYTRTVNGKTVSTKYKDLFVPPLTKDSGVINLNDETYFIDNQNYSKFLFMNEIRKTDLGN